MFLTRVELNPERRGARKLLGSPHAMHAAVESCFPPSHPAADPLDLLSDADVAGPGARSGGGRVLWRLDQGEARAVLYVVSPGKPDCTHLVEQAGRPALGGWQTRDYQPLLEQLQAGQTWAFRVTVNPTKSTRLKEGKRSQRVGHVTKDQQQQWFLERCARWGFSIPHDEDGEPLGLLIAARGQNSFRRQQSSVVLTTAVVEGELTVTDPEALREALVRGMGPAKGYGCGLLTLARARTGS